METEFGAVLAVTVAIISTISAVAAAFSAFAAMRQVKLMKEDFDRREQPYIYGRFDVYKSLIIFVLENKGSAPAVNVTARFDVAPIMLTGASLNDASLFSNPISFFPPGESYKQLIDKGEKFLGDGMPTEFKLNLTYHTLSGRPISDIITFDTTYMTGLLTPPDALEVSLATIADILKKTY